MASLHPHPHPHHLCCKSGVGRHLRRRDNPNPVTKGVLLQKLFGQIFEVAFGQRYIGGDGEFSVTITSNFDVIAELASLALNLDAVVQKLFEIRTIKNTVVSWLRVIDYKFMLGSSCFSSRGLRLEKREEEIRRHKPTEKETQQSGTEH